MNTTSLLLDRNNNLLYNENGFLIATEEEALSQDIRNRLRLYKGEYFLDPGLGFFYHEDLQNPDKNAILYLLKKVLSKDKRIRSYDIRINFDGKKLNLDIDIITKEGKKVNV